MMVDPITIGIGGTIKAKEFPQLWHWWHHRRSRNENFRKGQFKGHLTSGSTQLVAQT
jgi:hypothetical protein